MHHCLAPITMNPVAIVMSAARQPTAAMLQAFPHATIITAGGSGSSPNPKGSDTHGIEADGGTVPTIFVDSVDNGPAVAEAARRAGAQAVITPYETGLPAGAYARKVLGLPGTGLRAALACSDKWLMKRRFRAAGVPTMPFWLARNSAELQHLVQREKQVVVKPLFGGGSAGVQRLSASDGPQGDAPAGSDMRKSAFPLLVEKAADIEAELHADGVVRDGRMMWVAVSRYGEPMLDSARARRPYSSTVLDPQDPLAVACQVYATHAVAAVGLRDAVFHLELFDTPSGMKVSEIACRPAGGGVPRGVELAWGVDLVRASWACDCGLQPHIMPVFQGPVTHSALLDTPTPEAAAAVRDMPGVLDVYATSSTATTGVFYSASSAGFLFATPEAFPLAMRALDAQLG